ncbi:hypothetical protein AAHN97_14825 [Chitinophaga niabensis]|uniref:hypothetical protein n=1 Tax=Chitinophaga niabensis TaxID=536979 RepID=UPI0031BB75AF
MKPMIYSAIAALLVLSSCSTAYKTAQTPDDVYYSPGRAKVYANNTARSTQQQASNADEETYNDNGDDNYVTYQDEDEERYDYARRIDRFSRGYNGYYWDGYYADPFYGGPNIYMNNFYGYPSWGNSFSIGLGWGYNPYRWNNWYGNGWYGGGFGHPWYNSWYGSSWYGGGWYGNGWYGGGYPGGGWHGGGGYYYTRPANSWGPRGSSSSRVFNSNNYNSSNPRPVIRGSAPVRTFDRSGGTVVNPGNPNGGRGSAPRRTFDRAPSERPVTNPDSRPSRQAPSRNFDRSNSNDRPPVRQYTPEPSYRAPERSSAPERSYPSSSPSSSPAPARTTRPRGG